MIPPLLRILAPAVILLSAVAARAVVLQIGDVLVVDKDEGTLYVVDPVGGGRALISDSADGLANPFVNTLGVALEPEGLVDVVDLGTQTLLRIDPRDGSRFVASQGILFQLIVDVVVEEPSSFYVTDRASRGIFQVDRFSGSQVPFSLFPVETEEGEIQTGPFFQLAWAIAQKPDGDFFASDAGLDAIFEVEQVTGNRTIVSVGDQVDQCFAEGRPFQCCTGAATGDGTPPCAAAGSGPAFTNPLDIAIVDGEIPSLSGLLLVTDDPPTGSAIPPALFSFDPSSGVRAILSDQNTGSGPDFAQPQNVALSSCGSGMQMGEILVTDVGPALGGSDSGPGTLFCIDESGNRFELSTEFASPRGLAVVSKRFQPRTDDLMVIDAGQLALFLVEPLGGERAIVSGGAAPIGAGAAFQNPVAVAVDRSDDVALYVADAGAGSVIEVDPITGDRTTLSSGFTTPVSVAVNYGRDLLVLEGDPGAAAVIRVAVADGSQTVISSNAVGSGPAFAGPRSMALEPSRQIVVLDDSGIDARVLRVDRGSGDRELVSDATIQSSVDFVDPTALAVDALGVILVADDGLDAILRVDPRFGTRTTISSASVGAGDPFDTPRGIAVQSDGSLLVADGDRLIQVDPSSGERTLLGSGSVAFRADLVAPAGVASVGGAPPVLEGDLIVADVVAGDPSEGSIVGIDPETGDRRVLSSADVGFGIDLFEPANLAVEREGDVLVVDEALQMIVRVDPISGERSLFTIDSLGAPVPLPSALALDGAEIPVTTDLLEVLVVRLDPGTFSAVGTAISGEGLGEGPIFQDPRDLVVETQGSYAVVDPVLESVFRVDSVFGDRSIVSDASTGSGVALRDPRRIALEPGGSLLVADAVLDAVVRIDPVSGDRSILSGNGVGMGPDFGDVTDVTVDVAGRIFVADSVGAAVFLVDAVSGDRTEVASASAGSGPPLSGPRGISAVPEPAAELLGAAALLAVAVLRRFRSPPGARRSGDASPPGAAPAAAGRAAPA
jgi:streptogramin lyase